MRKHGRAGSLTSRFQTGLIEKDDSRRITSLHFQSSQQSYRWLTDSRRPVIKH